MRREIILKTDKDKCVFLEKLNECPIKKAPHPVSLIEPESLIYIK